PDDEVEEGHEEEREGEGGATGNPPRDPDGREPRTEPGIDRGLGHRTEGEGARGDAQLGHGEHDRQLVDTAQGCPRRGAGGRAGLEPVAAGSHEGELDDDEEGAQGEDEGRRPGDEQRFAHASLLSSSGPSVSPSTSSTSWRRRSLGTWRASP